MPTQSASCAASTLLSSGGVILTRVALRVSSGAGMTAPGPERDERTRKTNGRPVGRKPALTATQVALSAIRRMVDRIEVNPLASRAEVDFSDHTGCFLRTGPVDRLGRLEAEYFGCSGA